LNSIQNSRFEKIILEYLNYSEVPIPNVNRMFVDVNHNLQFWNLKFLSGTT